MTKAELLADLSHHNYVMLRPSPVAGIGVFALRDIANGCRDMFSKPDTQDAWITLTKKEVSELPIHAQSLIENYCLFDEEKYFVPDYGFKVMDMVNYLNHSATPNILSVNEGEYFEALEDIPTGTELLVNYGHIVQGTEGYDQ